MRAAVKKCALANGVLREADNGAYKSIMATSSSARKIGSPSAIIGNVAGRIGSAIGEGCG